MTKHLWDLDIEKIPSCWQEAYENDLRDHPSGHVVTFEKQNYDGNITVTEYFHDGVGYRKKIIELFNQEKAKAFELLSSDLESKVLFSQLFKIDLKLFNLLREWRLPNDWFEEDPFDPKDLEKNILETVYYFDEGKGENLVETMHEFVKYKLVKLHSFD
ncbi:hypothetical protein [Priestia megaterium]|uniref:hypothetical protein n=1 Tax=Priestia megaterium TaxID=1404 RepID=UPI001A93DC06|nr:hypothetical protein [Priestia megaterium]QSX20030.1 hypothetical protein J0P05_22775 [Priestia megaterium]